MEEKEIFDNSLDIPITDCAEILQINAGKFTKKSVSFVRYKIFIIVSKTSMQIAKGYTTRFEIIDIKDIFP